MKLLSFEIKIKQNKINKINLKLKTNLRYNKNNSPKHT